LITVLLAIPAYASSSPTFTERLERAKAVEGQPAPHEYIEKKIFAAMQTPAMKEKVAKCLKAPGTSKENFTLVADITKEGKVSGIDYQPRTNTAECLAAALSTMELPPPPASGNASLPIFIDWILTE
jgi:hypothetical protein